MNCGKRYPPVLQRTGGEYLRDGGRLQNFCPGALMLRFVVLATTLLVTIPGCRSEVRARKVIGVSLLTSVNPFFLEIGEALTREANQHGYDVVIANAEFNVDKQNKQVQDFLVSRVDALVLSPCDSRAIGPVIGAANAQGVPVFTVDIGCLAPGVKVVTHVATDNYLGGKQAAQAMIKVLGVGGGKIAILDHKPAESCILRVQGFKEVLAKYNQTPGIGKIDIVKELPGGGTKDMAYRAAEDLLQAHPDLRGIFAINDPSALGARAALEKANRADRVTLIGFDGQPEGKQAIRDGKIAADPIQFPDKLGLETARAIIHYFEGEEIAPVNLVPPRLYWQADALAELGK
jgi:ribose transport system substrate-binding protein